MDVLRLKHTARTAATFLAFGSCMACSPTPTTPPAGKQPDWQFVGEVTRDGAAPIPVHAMIGVRYPEVTSPLWAPSDIPDAPTLMMFVLWLHIGTADLPAGTEIPLAAWDYEPLHHCLSEVPANPRADVLFVEDMNGKHVFPAANADGEETASVTGELVLSDFGSASRGLRGHIDATITDSSAHTRHVKGTLRFVPSTVRYPHESAKCNALPAGP